MPNDLPESDVLVTLRSDVDRIMERLERLESSLSHKENLSEEAMFNAAQNRAAALPPLERFVPRELYDAALNHAHTLAAQQQKQRVDDLISSGLHAMKITPATESYFRSMCRTEEGVRAFEDFLTKAVPVIGPESGLDRRPIPSGSRGDHVTQFAANAQIREEFGTLERYTAFCRAQEAGLVVSVKREGA